MTPDRRLVRCLERATLTALPAPRQAFDGSFVIKLFSGGTGRGNAASSLDPAADPDLPARLDRIAAIYCAHGLPPRFRATPLDPPGLNEALAARGYCPGEESIVFAGAVAGLTDAAIHDEGGPSVAWMALIATAEYQTAARREEKRRTPDHLAAPGAWLVLQQDGADAAGLSSVVSGGCVGIFDLATRPEYRRRGCGARLIRHAAQWGAGHGARMVYAHVASGNAASRALQEHCGMREAYRYRYWLRA
jgi:GNAT superfamily N-acetyltransferase